MRRNILIASTIACTFIVALLTPSVYSVPPGTDDQIRDRLAPLGSVTRAAAVLQSAVDVSAEPLSGEAVYDQFCSVCHTAGVAGAPKFADNAIWEPRIAKGMEVLMNSTLYGINAMPARGGCIDCSDDELNNAVVYMLDAAK